MNVKEGIILGLIQGLTEFLPVSSSGHLALFHDIFGLEEATQAFDIFLHMATLIAVFIYYWKDIWPLIKNPFQRTTALLVAGTIPTVIAALLFNDALGEIFVGAKNLGFNFLFTGLVLLYADTRRTGKKKIRNMSIFDALVVGTMQGIAIAPAISRSGMTISGCLSRNMDRKNAAKFSFLLSIPAILGAMVLTLKDIITGEVALGETFGVLPIVCGCITAAISGYLAIRFMVKIIENKKLKWFAFYVFALGLFLIGDQFIFHLIIPA